VDWQTSAGDRQADNGRPPFLRVPFFPRGRFGCGLPYGLGRGEAGITTLPTVWSVLVTIALTAVRGYSISFEGDGIPHT
jgi:hypothetical protein